MTLKDPERLCGGCLYFAPHRTHAGVFVCRECQAAGLPSEVTADGSCGLWKQRKESTK